jgi:hypothetical protein
MAEAAPASPRARPPTRRPTGLTRATGGRAGLIRRAPVAVAILAGVLFAGVPVDAATHWTVVAGSSTTSEAKATTKPAAPGGVSASCSSSSKKKIVVTWNAVTHAKTYTIFENGSSTATATVTTTSWTSGTLSAGTYTFKVSATVGTNWSGTKSSATSKLTIASSTPKCS